MSGSVNPTFLNNLANPPAANPQYWGQQMQNMNALQDYNAKQATADAYRQATDPNTGQVDPAKFNALIARGAGAWNAGPAMMQQGQAQGAQAQGSSEQVAGHLAQLKVMSGEMSDLLQSGQPITADQIHARLNSLGQEGILTPTVMNGINADLNSQPPGADLTQWLRNHYATNLSASEALKNVTSQPQTVDQGDRKIVVEGNVNMPGGQRVGTSYQQGQAPPPLGTTVDIRHSDGTIETVLPDQVDSVLRNKPGSSVVQPGAGGGGGAANNPLNMRFVGQPGATNSGGFAAFSTPEAGQAATDALFHSYAAGGINTLSGLISKWAPPSENNTAGYIARVAKATGLDPNTPIDLTNPAIATKIQQAMAAVEGNKNARVMPPQGPQGGQQTTAAATPPVTTATPPAATTTAALPLPPAPVPPPPGSPFGATAFSQPSTALPAPPSQATAPNTTAAVPPVPTPQMAAAVAVARKTGRPAPVAGTDGLFANPDGSVGSGPRAGGLGRRADIPNALLAGVQTAQTTMPPANVLTAGPGAPTTGLPSGAAPTVPPPTAFGRGAFGSAPAGAPVTPPPPVVQPPAQAVPPQAQRGAGWSAPPGYAEAQQEAARGSAQDQVAFRRDLPAAQGRIFTAQQALQALEASKTGGGTGWLQAVNNVIGSYEPGFLKNIFGPNYDPATLATNRDLAEKYLTQIAMANASRIGPGTDAKLAAAFTGNPNTHIQNLAAQDVLKVQIGLDRMNQAMGDDMQRENVSPQEFANWRQTWARTHDPRAFVMDSIAEDPDRLAAFKESMKNASPQEKAIFRSSLVEAQRMGHVQMALPGQ